MNLQKAFTIIGDICQAEGWKKDQFIRIEDGKIKAVGNQADLPSEFQDEVIRTESSDVIVPGFIDVHIHGANGSDAMDATTDAIQNMASSLPKEGTTAFFPTTMTQRREAIERALENLNSYIKNDNGPGKAEVAGIHLEGPFVNPKRKGAQPGEYVIPPSVDVFDRWFELSGRTIKLVTLAPERDGGLELVRHLKELGVIPSIGHSDADYVEVKAAVEAGASHITHLYNGMKGLHHREPGTAGAALLLDELHVEIIADGFHIRPEMIDLAIRLKGLDKVVLITDAMRAKGLKDGKSELGGQTVYVSNGKATLEDGTLAGSILKLNHGVKNIMDFAGLSLPEAIKLATENPAREFGLYDRKGSIAPGKDADLVVLNAEYEPVLTLCRGETAFDGRK